MTQLKLMELNQELLTKMYNMMELSPHTVREVMQHKHAVYTVLQWYFAALKEQEDEELEEKDNI